VKTERRLMGATNVIKCNGPSCDAVKKEGNNWLAGMIVVEPGGVIAYIRPLVEHDVGGMVRAWCGIPCVQKDIGTALARVTGQQVAV
jgi:hypothetical protein